MEETEKRFSLINYWFKKIFIFLLSCPYKKKKTPLLWTFVFFIMSISIKTPSSVMNLCFSNTNTYILNVVFQYPNNVLQVVAEPSGLYSSEVREWGRGRGRYPTTRATVAHAHIGSIRTQIQDHIQIATACSYE